MSFVDATRPFLMKDLAESSNNSVLLTLEIGILAESRKRRGISYDSEDAVEHKTHTLEH